MIRTISPGSRTGSVRAPSSKSMAHRQLVIAALAEHPSRLVIDGISDDILATIDCLSALGADITLADGTLTVVPIDTKRPKDHITLMPRESGTTLRFMLPLIGVLGVSAYIVPEGRLAGRPLRELTDELGKHGMNFSFYAESIHVSGRLLPGEYVLPGDVSSQYISALLLSLPKLYGDSRLTVTGAVESKAYIDMTVSSLRNAGVQIDEQGTVYSIKGAQKYAPAEFSEAEGDWSNAAFFLCMGALSRKGITVSGLYPDSLQGDRQIVDILKRMGAQISMSGDVITIKRGKLNTITLDVSQIPDLMPAVSALMALADGTSRITNARRLRLKESDRLMTTCAFLRAIGADAALDGDGIVIKGKSLLAGGNADSFSDHRIAMALTLAAGGCESPVVINGAEAVSKSFPDFFKRFDCLEEEK